MPIIFTKALTIPTVALVEEVHPPTEGEIHRETDP